MNSDILFGIAIYAQMFIHLTEAKHDQHIIGTQASVTVPVEHMEEFLYHNKRWHYWDSIVWMLVHGLAALCLLNPWLIITGLAWRFVMLQIALNHFRDIDYAHLGNGFIDTWSRKILTTNGTLYFKLLIGLTLTCYAGYKILSNIF